MFSIKNFSLVIFALTLTACTTTQTQSDRISIPFANNGGIQDWRAIDEKSILIKARNNQWYRATFNRRCFNLNSNLTRGVGFKASSTGSFDKHSEVLVDGQRCQVKTLETWINPDEMKEQTEGGYVS